MTERTQDLPPVEGDAGTPPGDAGAEPAPKTAEEVEAFWRNRQSAEARAHAAETAELQRQLAEARNAPVQPAEGESPEAARVRALEAELQQERAARQAVELQSRYPLAAGVLGDAMTSLPAEKLAAMEAALETGAGSSAPPIIDPNAAPRGRQQPAKPVNEKTKDELLADLRTLAPAFQQAQREGSLD